MANLVAILVPIVVTFIIIAVSIYLFSVYCHRNPYPNQLKKEAWGTSSSPKSWSSCRRP